MGKIQKKKLLFIAPLPPPITGQSLISDFLLNNLQDKYDTIAINYNKKDAVSGSRFNISHLKKIFFLAMTIILNKKNIDRVYFTITQSFFGNLKDLFFLFLLGKKLRNRTVIHLHGGFFDSLFDRSFFIIKIFNKSLFKDVSKGIVLGNSLKKCLLPVLNENKICVLENYFSDDIKISINDFHTKWNNISPVKIMFLSNLMTTKGYLELLEAFFMLKYDLMEKFRLSFAGEFEDDDKKKYFLEKIALNKFITYHGIISGEKKISLLHESHVFILPTYYPIEGQPVSILESYASGLVVFTTDQGGIKDIFKDGVNGKLLEKKSSESILNLLVGFFSNIEEYKKIAENNLKYSENFNQNNFLKKMSDIFDDI